MDLISWRSLSIIVITKSTRIRGQSLKYSRYAYMILVTILQENRIDDRIILKQMLKKQSVMASRLRCHGSHKVMGSFYTTVMNLRIQNSREFWNCVYLGSFNEAWVIAQNRSMTVNDESGRETSSLDLRYHILLSPGWTEEDWDKCQNTLHPELNFLITQVNIICSLNTHTN
jgi:hypothetical protein